MIVRVLSGVAGLGVLVLAALKVHAWLLWWSASAVHAASSRSQWESALLLVIALCESTIAYWLFRPASTSKGAIGLIALGSVFAGATVLDGMGVAASKHCGCFGDHVLPILGRITIACSMIGIGGALLCFEASPQEDETPE